MFQFVYWLKAMATILITNSHYASIWPVSAMAAGGHLGNCLFFLVSGFCMCRIRESFPRWYAKRIVRIYPALWLGVLFNLATGRFRIDSLTAFLHCCFYPTWYHFIASIMVLYILFYAVRKLQEKLRIKTELVLLISLVVFAAVYLFIFDRSYYHIDAVEENWVRFQFWISMMIGAWLRENHESIGGRISAAGWAGLAVCTVVYFGAKVLVSRLAMLSGVQFLSPLTLIVLVTYLTVIFIKLEKMHVLEDANVLGKPVAVLASMTLEIYLVQNVIIKRLEHLPFPVNFLAVTGLVLMAAWIVHRAAQWVQEKLESWIFKGSVL